jgi:hypothetical protein
MSREPGPQTVGMRPATNTGSARRASLGMIEMFKEGAV